jgi:hypothetical protein
MKMIVVGNRMVYSVNVQEAEYYEKEDVTKVTLNGARGYETITIKGNQLEKISREINEANSASLPYWGTKLNDNNT